MESQSDDDDIEGVSNESNPEYKVVEQSPRGRFWRVSFKKYDELLGQGAYKKVYKGYDTEKGSYVAWSGIRLSSITQEERNKIIEEVKLCSALKHENLLHFVSAWGNPETDELVMITEIVTGGSLRQYLKKIGRPKLMVVKNWARDILKGLEYLHSQQPPIMHRDLKPDNIFVMSHNADIRIGDFGLSTAIRNSLNNTFLGTPEYMAPEIFESNYGVTVDIYSFGMCLTEICTLKPPYYEFDNLGSVCKAIIEGVQPKSYTMITDPEVKEFIALCLQRAEDRPTASQLLNHPFLIVDKNDPKVHKPVQCADQEEQDSSNGENSQKRIQNNTVNLGMKILQGGNEPIQFTFNMDLVNDTAESVAETIIRQFNLQGVAQLVIAKQIQSKINQIIDMDGYNPSSNGYLQAQTFGYIDEVSSQSSNQSRGVRKSQSEWDLQQLLHPCSNFYITRRNQASFQKQITDIQLALQQIYKIKLTCNGFYGRKTETYVKFFQKKAGLSPNGLITQELYDMILSNLYAEKAEEIENDSTSDS